MKSGQCFGISIHNLQTPAVNGEIIMKAVRNKEELQTLVSAVKEIQIEYVFFPYSHFPTTHLWILTAISLMFLKIHPEGFGTM